MGFSRRYEQSTSHLFKRDVPSSCASRVSPTCLQALYGIPKTRASRSSITLAVAGFLDEFANETDLATFLNISQDLADRRSEVMLALEKLEGPDVSVTESHSALGIVNLDGLFCLGQAYVALRRVKSLNDLLVTNAPDDI
ncbi:hypothetical protein BGZ59_001474 [Podila verticillata]|uniref:Uncharacterized protein n=1 Tax=Podila verticillata NRRL 6337 TaxID=1069443 RepID=A0A086TIY8_9FUNG|nr:hypothetical protein BGZ59_001474 [Podila verticillata]KFH61915.1 hypothetical protein MVEG_12249 [Podila verticillata NRRL 6337]